MLTQQNAFLNSNLALPMGVREVGRVNSAKRFPMGRVLGCSMIVFDYKLKSGKDFVFN
nr:hypothetical protein [Leptospira interrogans]